MKEHTRRAVAYIAGRLVSGSSSSSVFDYAASKHFPFSGTVNAQNVSAYDHTENCHISGSGGDTLSLYHHGNGRHINLKVDRQTLSGYDHDSGTHFSGTVTGNSVSIYDYQTSSYFNYSV